MQNLKKLILPERYNYIGCFLTLDCNFHCQYCINNFGKVDSFKRPILSGKEWIRGLNRILPRNDLPVTLQGGEPGMHPDFIWIINNIIEGFNIDILTNLTFNVEEFIKKIKPSRLKRNAPYPSIRVSFHPSDMNLDVLIRKVLKLQDKGFSIGVYGILHPKYASEILKAQEKCTKLGIDFRTKEFLGEFEGSIYGTYLYPQAIHGSKRKNCLCRTNELIIGPTADIYRCHHDLYKNFPPIGNLLDNDFEIEDIFRECSQFGDCNPCDIKVKTDRFQIFGHTSVEIKNVTEKR